MTAVDLQRFADTPLERDPFDYLVVPGFVRGDAVDEVVSDYPDIPKAGSYPLEGLNYGPAFSELMAEMTGPQVRNAFEEKFGIDLTDRPTLISVRGHCQAKDGRIHTDSEDKIITVLVYMNTDWENDTGRLRLLRGPDDLEDYAAEVPPAAGTLLAFRRSDRSWHGHHRHVGARKVFQLNWVTDDSVVRRERRRHGLSARIKGLLGRG